MFKKFVFLISSVSILGLLVHISFRYAGNKNPITEVPDAYAAADWYAQNAEAITTDASGKIVQHYQAEKLLSYKQQNYTHIIKPKVEIMLADQAPWKLQAANGKAIHQGKKLERFDLWQKVRLEQNNTKKPPIMLNTEKLSIIPQKKIAQSNDFVTITSNKNTIQGKGFLFNLEDETFNINQSVRSHYAFS